MSVYVPDMTVRPSVSYNKGSKLTNSREETNLIKNPGEKEKFKKEDHGKF